MRRRVYAAAAIAAAGAAVAALASETISYSYDAQGRLVKSLHTGSVNNNLQATYSHDKADNRATMNVTGA